MRTHPSNPRSRNGFSIIELLIVVGIILVVTTIAFPSVTRSMRAYRLSSTAANVAGSLQLARFNAVRLNRTNPPVSWRWVIQGNQNILWVDENNNGAPDATEPRVQFATDITVLTAGNAPSVASMGYASTQISPGAIAFDARGTVNFGANAPTVYVLVFGFAGLPAEGYTAVSVTPFGKMQQWRASANGKWQKR